VDKPFTLKELGNTYATANHRYVVSFIASYDDEDTLSPAHAVARALSLTRDDESYSTHWYVFDRETRVLHLVEQVDAEALCEED
jgi:hypothetical protein